MAFLLTGLNLHQLEGQGLSVWLTFKGRICNTVSINVADIQQTLQELYN